MRTNEPEIYAPEAEGVNIEATRIAAESRLGAPLRVDMTTENLLPTIPNPVRAPE